MQLQIRLQAVLTYGAGFAAGAARASPGIDVHLTRASAERQARALAGGGKGGAVSFLDELAADGRRILRGPRDPGARAAYSPPDDCAEGSESFPAGDRATGLHRPVPRRVTSHHNCRGPGLLPAAGRPAAQ